MGGKSRKTGQLSQKLIDRLKKPPVAKEQVKKSNTREGLIKEEK